MTPEECIKTCCVIECKNNSSNSQVKFFSFPEHRFRSYQRNRWVHVIKSINGRSWMPTMDSLVCGEHFVKGHPNTNSQVTDYAPSVFSNKRKVEDIRSHNVTVKKFGLEYIKHDALLEKPSRANANNRNRAYEKLAATLGIAVKTVRAWERRFREYCEEKLAKSPVKTEPSADGKTHWLTTVAKRLYANTTHRRAVGSPVSPSGVVAALCAAARERGSLCSTGLYNEVRRVLRLSSAISDLHAIWVSAQRVSLQQVLVAGRAGDAAHAAPPAAAATVADLVLLYTDVDIVTDESLTLYEESAALHTLWQLIQRHRLEDAAPAHSRVRAQRWSRAHRSYTESGRTVSLVVLQRRWYELKLQARVRLAMHWRRPPGPQLVDDPAPDPTPTPHEAHPRPAPLHIAILKRYPHIATGQFTSWRQQVLEGTIVTELLEEDNDVTETQSNNNDQSTTTKYTGDDANMNKVEQPTFDVPVVEQLTFDVPMVEQPPVNDSLTERLADTDLLKKEIDVKDTRTNDSQQFTDTVDADDDAAAKQLYPNMSRVEQPTVDEPKYGQTFYNVPLVEQSAADDQLAKQPTAYEPKVIKVEQNIDSGSLNDDHMAKQTTDNDVLVEQRTVDDPLPVQTTVVVPKIEQAMNYGLSINQSTVRTLAASPKDHAGNAPTEEIPDMLDTPDTQSGPNISSEQIHRAKDKSNEVIPPQRAYTYDTDTDTEDNLVIDERTNQTPSHKLEPAPHTETQSFDTVSPHVALRKSAPTIEVLHMIDPNTVKTEILFESDEDDFEPCNELDKDKIELEVKKEEVSFISDRIMFVEEDPVVSVCNVKSEDDVTGHMDWEHGQEMDVPVNDTPTIDPKLLMDAQVRLFRIDEIRAWYRNVRKDNSIRVSRIHRKYYTPNPKNGRNNNKKRTQNTRLDVELRSSARLTTTTTTTQDIRVDKSCLDKIANTHSIRRLCSNIKRELLDEQLEMLEDKIPNKKAKTESDSEDDKPLLVLREGKLPREITEETGVNQATVVRQMVEESSSDDELMDDEMFDNLRGEERKRGRGAYYAASTIEWSADFAPALGRVAKRVSLPDLESVRRHQRGVQVAQVAPITSTVGADGDEAMQAGQLPDDTTTDDTPEVWRTLDLPADDELQAALDGLTTAPAAEAVQERSHCCAARRHREVNDSRRRIGLDEIPLHNHPDGVCTCCCTHLSDVDVRHRLDQQLRVLHQDIEQMLRKSAGGKIQLTARASTSGTTATAATSAHKQVTKDAPSNTATVAKGPKAKPVTDTNRPKKRRTRVRAAPPRSPSPPAPPVNDFEEWQRQKNMNAKYFHINSNVSFKKDISTTGQDAAEQSTITLGTAAQSITAHGRAVQRNSAQRTAAQSPIAQTVTEQSTIAQNAMPPQNIVQPGLMPYIRQSRLISPQKESRRRRANPVPARHRINPVAIAPKPSDIRRATEHAHHNTIVNELKEGTKNVTIPNYQSQAASPRRMNLTTEQMSEPTQPVQVTRVNSGPIDKPVSILEEYSRTLNTEPVNNTPVVNALSIRVPSGPTGPKTTIVMALTLPSDEVIKQTINRLYANDTVDLTEESETSKSDIEKTTSQDLVAAVKFFMNPVNENKSDRSRLKPVTATEDGKCLLKTKITSALDGLQDTTNPSATRDKALKMPLSKKLRDGDIIEIEDTDSNHSNSNDSNRTENSILTNESSNPIDYSNKDSNQAKAGSTKESSDQSTSKPDESSNQPASKGDEAVSERNETASQAGPTNSTNQATEKDISSKTTSKTKKSKERSRYRYIMPDVFKRCNMSEEAVSSHSMARSCSLIPVLKSLTDGSQRCPARFANVAAMTDFMNTLRRAATQSDKEVYCHKWSAVEQSVSALPCGGTLLCVDGSRPPLVLAPREARARRERATPHARAHLVLTDADPPCALPTYWTLSAFGKMARVLPDELLSAGTPAVRGAGGTRWRAPRGETVSVAPREDRKICEKNHNFKILTAFCSADGIRQAARAGASLLLLSMLRARVVVLTLRRDELGGGVRHRASADVEEDLLRELEGLLDEAEINEQLGKGADIIGQ